jgi:hypothetical protein
VIALEGNAHIRPVLSIVGSHVPQTSPVGTKRRLLAIGAITGAHCVQFVRNRPSAGTPRRRSKLPNPRAHVRFLLGASHGSCGFSCVRCERDPARTAARAKRPRIPTTDPCTSGASRPVTAAATHHVRSEQLVLAAQEIRLHVCQHRVGASGEYVVRNHLDTVKRFV